MYCTGGSLVGSISASQGGDPAIDPRVQHILSWKIFSQALSMIQEELVVSYW